MEERFVLNEITKELYEKFSKKYTEQILQLRKETQQSREVSSNLEKAVEKGLEYSENFCQTWSVADFNRKQQLQYLVFPKGMSYDKESNRVLTTKVNTLFAEIAIQSRVLEENKKDLSPGTIMTVPGEEAPANFVPAAAVIRRGLALLGITGRKGSVGGSLSWG